MQRIFFAYLHFSHHSKANPFFTKWYMEKAAHIAINGPDPDRKNRPKSSVRTQVPASNKPHRR